MIGIMQKDLFPGFDTRILTGDGASVFARVGGNGRPLLLLHGYPQTHVCWHKIAPQLAEDYTVVVCDLRGYGASGTPEGPADASRYAKREMARDLVAAMNELGFPRFLVAGHDRGARVAYRMALDHSRQVAALAVLSILPTFAMWSRLENNETAVKMFHWFFLAQDPPIPEEIIQAAGVKYIHPMLRLLTSDKTLSAFHPDALDAYERAFTNPSTIAASCFDYRAGWMFDRIFDQVDVDLRRKIACPTLAYWGRKQFPDDGPMIDAWRRIADNVVFQSADCGHFVAEEAPDAVLSALRAFFHPVDVAALPDDDL